MGATSESGLPRLFTPSEVAEALGQSENYVLAQCRAGRWPHVRVARGAIRLSRDDYDQVVQLCHRSAGATAPLASLLTPLSQRRRRRSA